MGRRHLHRGQNRLPGPRRRRTSDFSDPWAITNPNYQNEFTTSSSNDYYAVDYSPSGEFIVTGSEDGFVRIWNASTWTNLRSASTNTDVNSVDYSADGMYVAAGLGDDTINIYYSSNLTSVHGAISVDVGGNDQVNSVEFSPDSSTGRGDWTRQRQPRHQRGSGRLRRPDRYGAVRRQPKR